MLESSSNQEPMAVHQEVVHLDRSFEPLVPRFISNRKREILTIREAVAKNDFETVRSVSHGMKGVGGSYGFDHITELAATMEQAAKSADTTIITQQLQSLEEYLNGVRIAYE